MPSMSLEVMRQFLSTSISSGKKGAGVINRNKLHGPPVVHKPSATRSLRKVFPLLAGRVEFDLV